MVVYLLTFDGYLARNVFPHEAAAMGKNGLITGRQDGIEVIFNSSGGKITDTQRKALEDLRFGFVPLRPAAGSVQ